MDIKKTNISNITIIKLLLWADGTLIPKQQRALFVCIPFI